MDSLKSRFEKALKTKLLYKTSGHMAEEVLLLKNFKYFDEDETNEANIDTFLKVIAKVGATSMKDMGAVMKEAKAEIGASADGKSINEVVANETFLMAFSFSASLTSSKSVSIIPLSFNNSLNDFIAIR